MQIDRLLTRSFAAPRTKMVQRKRMLVTQSNCLIDGAEDRRIGRVVVADDFLGLLLQLCHLIRCRKFLEHEVA